MNASVKHFQINVTNFKEAAEFYKKLFGYFEYKIVADGDTYIGFLKNDVSIWFLQTDEKFLSHEFNRDGSGLNHFAFHVEKREDVDTFYNEFMKSNNIKPEFETPRDRPEMGTYYQIMFLGPDNLGLEVVYTKFA